jgi:multicomponent Na+:H+ antiporter subunit G
MTELVAGGLVVVGSALTVISAIGLYRFRDAFARVHAAGKAAPLGAALVFAGAALQFGELAVAARFALVLGLLSLTFPVGVHMVVRAAYRSGTELAPDVTVDELSDARRRRDEG